MTNRKNANRVAKLNLDEVVAELRRDGYKIRFYGNEPLTYEVITPGQAYCLRTEEGLRGILLGQDHWLESIGELAARVNA